MAIGVAGKQAPMRIGCDMAVWIPLSIDEVGLLTEATTNKAAYEKILKYDTANGMRLPGVMALNVNPNMDIATAFYDDGPAETATTLGNIEVTFDKAALSIFEKAKLLGKKLTLVKKGATDEKTAILVNSANDVPGWGALGFRTMRSDGTYRYVWLLKGKFTDPADNNETKGESINFQNDQMSGRFVKLNAEFEVKTGATYNSTTKSWTTGTKTEILKPWKTEMDASVDSIASIYKNEKFLEQVVLPIMPKDS